MSNEFIKDDSSNTEHLFWDEKLQQYVCESDHKDCSKPILGIQPTKIWASQRIMDLCDAIKRQVDIDGFNRMKRLANEIVEICNFVENIEILNRDEHNWYL